MKIDLTLNEKLTGKHFMVFIDDDGRQVQFAATVLEKECYVGGEDVVYLVKFHQQPSP
jgi:hypothetical protein